MQVVSIVLTENSLVFQNYLIMIFLVIL